MMQNFQNLNVGWFKFKHEYASWKENYARKKLNYPICNASDGYCLLYTSDAADD